MQKQFYFTIALVLTDSDDIQIVIFCNVWLDVDLNFDAAMTILGCQQDTLGNREAQLRNCLRQTGRRRGIFLTAH